MYIEDFKEQLQGKKYNDIYQKIVNKTIYMAKKIAKLKKLELNFNVKDDIYDIFLEIEYSFNKYSATFRDLIYLVKNLKSWYEEDDLSLYDTQEQKLESYIRGYNLVESELKKYFEIKDLIVQYGFENIKLEKMNKLIKLFKDMLKYKNKPYLENWSFRDYIEKIDLYYNIYSEYLLNALEAVESKLVRFDIESDYIQVNDVEVIMFLDLLYDTLSYENDDYKMNAYFYRDFELKDDQTLSDIYDIEYNKFLELLKKMLDFVNGKYDKDEKYLPTLISKVAKYYPFYKGCLSTIIARDPNTSLVDILSNMEDVYEKLETDYTNYEKNMKEYKVMKDKNLID